MVDKSSVKEMADRYIRRVKVSTDEARKAFEKSISELDLIGNEMYEEIRVNLKDSGFDIEKMQAKMKEELMKDRDELKNDFWRVESRLVKFGEDVEKEIRKTFRQD